MSLKCREFHNALAFSKELHDLQYRRLFADQEIVVYGFQSISIGHIELSNLFYSHMRIGSNFDQGRGLIVFVNIYVIQLQELYNNYIQREIQH